MRGGVNHPLILSVSHLRKSKTLPEWPYQVLSGPIIMRSLAQRVRRDLKKNVFKWLLGFI